MKEENRRLILDRVLQFAWINAGTIQVQKKNTTINYPNIMDRNENNTHPQTKEIEIERERQRIGNNDS